MRGQPDSHWAYVVSLLSPQPCALLPLFHQPLTGLWEAGESIKGVKTVSKQFLFFRGQDLKSLPEDVDMVCFLLCSIVRRARVERQAVQSS